MKKQFGELEDSVLQLIKQQEAATVKEIHNQFEEMAYTTIMTVMYRLFKKGFLNRKKIKNRYVYHIAKKYPSHYLNIFQRLKQKIFGNSSVTMISYLLENTETSQEELKEIEQLIQQKTKK